MLLEHRGRHPRIDPSAWVAPTAVVCGDVRIGPGTRILYGAVLTAEGREPITIGRNAVIMEHAVLRAAGRWPLDVGDYVLIGPHAHLSGCAIGAGSFIATGAMVFNGARLGSSCVVALSGKVHVETQLTDNTFVPIGHIAIGRPGQVYPPEQAPVVHEELNRLGFLHHVFGVDPAGRSRAEVMAEVMSRYAGALGAHREDRVVRRSRPPIPGEDRLGLGGSSARSRSRPARARGGPSATRRAPPAR
jgi:carbonic anhydrase/acetyltransferase-like protein (isoleucine patch superfamily)